MRSAHSVKVAGAIRTLCLACTVLAISSTAIFAQEAKTKVPPGPGPMLSQGMADFDTPDFSLSLVRSSQTVAALKPKAVQDFDFTPGDLLDERSQNGYFHLGDLTLRLRAGKSVEWRNFSTSQHRSPVRALETSKGTLAAADLTPTLPPELSSGNQAFMGTRVWKTGLTICLEEQIARGYCNWRSRHSDDFQQCAQRTLP